MGRKYKLSFRSKKKYLFFGRQIQVTTEIGILSFWGVLIMVHIVCVIFFRPNLWHYEI